MVYKLIKICHWYLLILTHCIFLEFNLYLEQILAMNLIFGALPLLLWSIFKILFYTQCASFYVYAHLFPKHYAAHLYLFVEHSQFIVKKNKLHA